MLSSALTTLMKNINYRFKNTKLLQLALTHRSVGKENNERLEFLGDALLDAIIADALYHRYPHHTEGQLSRARSHLVCGDYLAKIADQCQLSSCIYVGQSEKLSGNLSRSILSNVMEALVAAVYLDAGFDACRQWLLSCYEGHLDVVDNALLTKDAKTQLQEWAQQYAYSLPTYDIVRITGKAHQQQFMLSCVMPELSLKTQGEGKSRRRAEQVAAARMLTLVQNKTNTKESDS